jgi:hypothetical protein
LPNGMELTGRRSPPNFLDQDSSGADDTPP